MGAGVRRIEPEEWGVYGGGGRQVEGFGWRWGGPWEFAVHGNGSDAGRSRLTFRPLARCSRGAFINSSVLIPRIDEWPPIAIPCAPYSGCPLLASWIAYKFYLSQDFNSIPALDTRPLRIPPLPPQNGNIAPPLPVPSLWMSFYFLFFIFFPLVRSSASLPPFSRYRRFTPRFHWNHATRNPTPLPSAVFLFSSPFPLSFVLIRLDGYSYSYFAAIKGDPVLRHPCNKPVWNGKRHAWVL